jgi:hypothetical protein
MSAPHELATEPQQRPTGPIDVKVAPIARAFTIGLAHRQDPDQKSVAKWRRTCSGSTVSACPSAQRAGLTGRPEKIRTRP